MRLSKPLLSIFAALFLGLGLAHAEKGELYTTIDVPTGLSKEGTQAAVIKAALGRRWTIVSKTDDQIVLNLKHRGYDSTLTFDIEESQVKLYSNSWATDKKGNKKKKKEPTGWIENIKKDIGVFMNAELYG